ncbi:MAG TPA: matrixin family metalloprotease [Bryobacteraceae bacterium]|nr:matrixin family metalloprotease [Bryobacteraceae bacterium]
MRTLSRLFLFVLLAGAAVAQPPLHFKALQPGTESHSQVLAPPKTRTPARAHWIVQFGANPSSDQLRELAARGATVLSYVPDFALAISAPAGTSFDGLELRWAGRMRPDEKISPLLEKQLVEGSSLSAVVEFYADVDPGDARAIATAAGLVIREHPDLLPYHLLVTGSGNQMRELALWDEVSYIFPASPDLLAGRRVRGCDGGLTGYGSLGQAVALIDDGWAGPSHGSAALSYAFVNLTEQLPADSTESEIVRALSQWAQYAQLTFTPTSDSTAPRTLAVLFASYAHGDGYPFTGPGGVLAHTFYPVPTNPEPIAGDMHFNDSESWKIGADTDVFSVALHEAGHALGLGHSDDPADVMYPYYRKVTGLAQGDITGIQSLYAPQNGTTSPSSPSSPATPTAPAPLVLNAQAPPSSTSASSIAMSGTASGGSGTIQVSWRTNQDAIGTAQGSSNWTIASIPLSTGSNAITIVAQDAKQDQVAQTYFVTRVAAQQPSGPAPPSTPQPPAGNPTPSPAPPNPAPGGNSAPPTINILSPATTTVATSNGSIVVSGTASDNAGVAQITWSASTGGSGVASGTNNWVTPAIPLYVGTTTIIIQASDTAGNTAWRSLTVTRY